MLPVMLVTAAAPYLLILLEVRGVDDGAPAVIALGSGVRLAISQVEGVAAETVNGSGNCQALRDGTVGIDCRSGVAPVIVIVVSRREGHLIPSSILRHAVGGPVLECLLLYFFARGCCVGFSLGRRIRRRTSACSQKDATHCGGDCQLSEATRWHDSPSLIR